MYKMQYIFKIDTKQLFENTYEHSGESFTVDLCNLLNQRALRTCLIFTLSAYLIQELFRD